MLIQEGTEKNSIANYGTIKNVYSFLELVQHLLFLVLQAFMVLIMHELDYRKNLVQKCTVIPYCSAALAIFEVILNSVMYMHYLYKNLGKLLNLNPIFMP